MLRLQVAMSFHRSIPKAFFKLKINPLQYLKSLTNCFLPYSCVGWAFNARVFPSLLPRSPPVEKLSQLSAAVNDRNSASQVASWF